MGYGRLRLPHYLEKRLIDGGKVVSPTSRPHFTPRFLYFKRFLVFISVKRLSRHQGHGAAGSIRSI
jgi:hypothetical protein